MGRMKQLTVNFYDNEENVGNFLDNLKEEKLHIYSLLFNDSVTFETKRECLKNLIDEQLLVDAVLYRIILANN